MIRSSGELAATPKSPNRGPTILGAHLFLGFLSYDLTIHPPAREMGCKPLPLHPVGAVT